MTTQESRKSVLDLDPHPWVTFRDLLEVDAINRREDAMYAVLRWSSAGITPATTT